jgi:hypothetical protein
MFFFVRCYVCVVVCIVHACVVRVRREGVSVLYRDVKAVGNASRASTSVEKKKSFSERLGEEMPDSD